MKLVPVGGLALLVALGCGGSSDEEREMQALQLARQQADYELFVAQERVDAEAAAAAAPTPEPAPAAPAPAIVASEWEGDITRAASGVIVVEGAEGAPPVGAKGTLSKKIDQKFGGMSISAWLVIADVVVESSSGGTVAVKVTQEQSVTEVNGNKVDHFKPGGHVKLEVGP